MKDHTEGKEKKKYGAVTMTAAVVAVLVILYAAAGFLVAPPILKSKLEEGVSHALGVTATVADVGVNPFALSVDIKGFDMNHDGETVARFEELYINFQLSSLFRRTFTFSAIRLVGPEGLVKILPDGSVNWLALMPAGKDQSSETAPENISPAENPTGKGIVPLLIHRLEIDRGRLTFLDRSLPTPFEADIYPIRLSLEDFSTRQDDTGGFSFASTLGAGGEIHGGGAVSVNPLHSHGKLELRGVTLRTVWEYVRDRVNFEIADGSADVALDYTFDAGKNGTHFEVKEGSLALKNVDLREKGAQEALIAIPLFTCENVGFNLEDRALSIGSLSSAHADIAGWREEDGRINFQRVFASQPGEQSDAAAPEPNDEGANKNGTWRIGIDTLSLEDYGITFEDRTNAVPARVVLDPIDLHIKNLTNRSGSQAEIDLRLTVNQTGRIEAKGSAGLDPQKADFAVAVSDIALKPFQPYVDTVAKLTIAGGAASFDGTILYNGMEGSAPLMSCRGNLRVDGLDARDRARSEDLLKWKSLALSGIELDISPTSLTIADILFTRPYARVIIFPDRTVNLAAVFPREKGEESNTAPPSAEKETEKESGPVPITIGAIRIENGSQNFADLSLTPNFATGIQNLNGTIKGLSSDPSARAEVSLMGAVDTHAPVSITGMINPLSPSKYVDIALSFKNMELTTLTPYSGKFAGYAIEKGKMSLDLQYKLEGDHLVGKNKLFLNQLTLGERVESPSATKLPVSLAIALLKDRKGNIDIDLPVKGNINDPEFSYGKIVINALVNLITKIITSPFAALGSIFGGGEDISHIDFAYGSAELTPEHLQKLDTIARALYERPALRFEIRGVADRTSDRAALAEKRMMRELKKLKAQELRALNQKVPADEETITISSEEYERLLTKAYETLRGGKPAGQQKPVATVQEMKQALVDGMVIEDSDLRQLATQRAQRVKGYLLKEGNIENERIFILDSQINDASEFDTARMVLSLS